MAYKAEQTKDCHDCKDCKNYCAGGRCSMAEAMPEEEREMFVKNKRAGCYWFDSIKWG